MKKTWMAPAVCMFLLCNLLVTANVSAVSKDWLEKLTGFKPDGANETEICLIEDGETECCLYAKDESSLFTPAGGIVLWMTAKLAAENLDLQERVEVGSIETLYGSSREIGLKEKYDLTVKDLLAATLLYGAQDAAYVLAVKTAGTAEDFVRMMNDEASLLQMKDTVYKNPCGSPEDGQVTTARDCMILARAVMEMPSLSAIVSLQTYTLAEDTGLKDNAVVNRCKMMHPDDGAYDERIKSAALGTTSSTGTIAVFVAMFQDKNIFLVMKSTGSTDQINCAVKKLLDDTFTYERIDLLPIIKNKAKSLIISTEKAKAVSCGVMTINGDSLLYFVPPDFARSFDALKLALAVDSITIADDICLHGIAALAQVRYSGEYVTDVLLTAEKIQAQEINAKEPEPEKGKETGAPLEANNTIPPDSKPDQYGWVVYIIGTGVLSLGMIVLSKIVRKRIY